MAISQDFLDFLHDQLHGLGHITTRRMFSGAAIYCDGVVFALVLRDVLHFKVDDGNRGAYEAEGLRALHLSVERQDGAHGGLPARAGAPVR